MDQAWLYGEAPPPAEAGAPPRAPASMYTRCLPGRPILLRLLPKRIPRIHHIATRRSHCTLLLSPEYSLPTPPSPNYTSCTSRPCASDFLRRVSKLPISLNPRCIPLGRCLPPSMLRLALPFTLNLELTLRPTHRYLGHQSSLFVGIQGYPEVNPQVTVKDNNFHKFYVSKDANSSTRLSHADFCFC